jgi:O-antigen ligase
MYFNSTDEWLFKGIGAGSDAYFLSRSSHVFANTHNSFIQVAIQLGIIGAAIGIAWLLAVVWNAWAAPTRRMLIAGLSAYAVTAFTLDVNESNMLWAIFGLAICGAYRRRTPVQEV